jgi:DNA-binding transcriptional LysR family regulator
MDVSVPGLRVMREVAERGSFTAAAAMLGYTQSAVSRQVAALESALGVLVFERHRGGVRLTSAGRVVLRHAVRALDEIDAAMRAASGQPPTGAAVRLGAYPSAGAVLLPAALSALRRANPEIDVSTREATTPALVRALRAGTLDLAVLATTPPFRALDRETPELVVDVIAEADLQVAVPANHPLALDDAIDLERLRGQRWIASPSSAGEQLLGVWPALAGRPRVAHSSRDWLTKLRLVAAGCGITTVPGSMRAVVPDGVRVLPVRGGPRESRRVLLARMPGRRSAALRTVQDAVRAAAAGDPPVSSSP